MPEPKPVRDFEHWAYDTRDGRVIRFKRMTRFVVLQTVPMNRLSKVSFEEFDKFFEGMPPPAEPYLKLTR